jgi:hypothetical protein
MSTEPRRKSQFTERWIKFQHERWRSQTIKLSPIQRDALLITILLTVRENSATIARRTLVHELLYLDHNNPYRTIARLVDYGYISMQPQVGIVDKSVDKMLISLTERISSVSVLHLCSIKPDEIHQQKQPSASRARKDKTRIPPKSPLNAPGLGLGGRPVARGDLAEAQHDTAEASLNGQPVNLPQQAGNLPLTAEPKFARNGSSFGSGELTDELVAKLEMLRAATSPNQSAETSPPIGKPLDPPKIPNYSAAAPVPVSSHLATQIGQWCLEPVDVASELPGPGNEPLKPEKPE